jgi:hypothetical protein
MDGFVAKPIRPPELFAAIDALTGDPIILPEPGEPSLPRTRHD